VDGRTVTELVEVSMKRSAFGWLIQVVLNWFEELKARVPAKQD